MLAALAGQSGFFSRPSDDDPFHFMPKCKVEWKMANPQWREGGGTFQVTTILIVKHRAHRHCKAIHVPKPTPGKPCVLEFEASGEDEDGNPLVSDDPLVWLGGTLLGPALKIERADQEPLYRLEFTPPKGAFGTLTVQLNDSLRIGL